MIAYETIAQFLSPSSYVYVCFNYLPIYTGIAGH